MTGVVLKIKLPLTLASGKLKEGVKNRSNTELKTRSSLLLSFSPAKDGAHQAAYERTAELHTDRANDAGGDTADHLVSRGGGLFIGLCLSFGGFGAGFGLGGVCLCLGGGGFGVRFSLLLLGGRGLLLLALRGQDLIGRFA